MDRHAVSDGRIA